MSQQRFVAVRRGLIDEHAIEVSRRDLQLPPTPDRAELEITLWLPRTQGWRVADIRQKKAAQCAALELVGPHGLEPWTKGL
jgi:hypothetical protein